MKQIVFTTLLTLFATSTYAQNFSKLKSPYVTAALEQTDFLKKAVNLSDPQVKNIYPLILENATKIGALKAKYPTVNAKSLLEKKNIANVTLTALKKLLTPDQVVKFKVVEQAFLTKLGG